MGGGVGIVRSPSCLDYQRYGTFGDLWVILTNFPFLIISLSEIDLPFHSLWSKGKAWPFGKLTHFLPEKKWVFILRRKREQKAFFPRANGGEGHETKSPYGGLSITPRGGQPFYADKYSFGDRRGSFSHGVLHRRNSGGADNNIRGRWWVPGVFGGLRNVDE